MKESQERKISIIIPVYNVEKYLDECVQSVVNQSYKNLEIILVDDGSTDNCPQMCDNYALQDSRIKIVHKANGGLSDARNAGIDVATGTYIGFVDSDDCILENMYEELLSVMDYSNADIVSSKFFLYQDGKEKICTWSSMSGYIEGNVLSLKEYFALVVNETLDNSVWNKLYKAEVVTERFKKRRNNEDYLFFSRLAQTHPNTRIAFTNSAYYKYRQEREGSICADRMGLDLAVLANKSEILADIDSWASDLKDKIKSQRDHLLFAIIYNLTTSNKLRQRYKHEYSLLRREFWKLRAKDINANHIDVFLLKYIPWLYNPFAKLRAQLRNY